MPFDRPDLESAGKEVDTIPVHINSDIIRLFSEGLYRSPHKAIEELVSNGYDAGANRVHILLPDEPDDDPNNLLPLWVIDDGEGMDEEGFRRLWRVADSEKANARPPYPKERPPIGQFGIGKLAAYVLARKLTHLSYANGELLLTTMDFGRATGRQSKTADPPKVSLRKITEQDAKNHLSEIKIRDPEAWAFMFSQHGREPSWTAVGLSDFKELYRKLSIGRLKWVLSTGLPLHTDFRVSVNRDSIESSKVHLEVIKEISISENSLGVGKIRGSARIYKKQLSGKSDSISRSNGFFVRVRGRVINLDDELFGIRQPNHAAWSRFALEVDADGLRDHLLSSREGVRDSEDIEKFREYLLEKFNECRAEYDRQVRSKTGEMDLDALLSGKPSAYVTEPLLRSVRSVLKAGSESFYIAVPEDVDAEKQLDWLHEYENAVSEKPFENTGFARRGPYTPALQYDPKTRKIIVNSDHPFVDKLTSGDKYRNPAKLFAWSEVLLEGNLQEQGVDQATIDAFLRDRDRVLRERAGDAPSTASEVLRRLDAARNNPDALERAVGLAFRELGFEYERRGEKGEPDGVIDAKLGLHSQGRADYRVVYDTKQTNQPQVPADKIDIASMEVFRRKNGAQFGCFVGVGYSSENDRDGKLNKKMETDSGQHITLFKLAHLERLIRIHLTQGVTLTKLRSLFENARTVPQVNDWLDKYNGELERQGQVPLGKLLRGLEAEKEDSKARPSLVAVRAKQKELQQFEPPRLLARLKAVEHIVGTRWIEVDDNYEVNVHQTAEEILGELERSMRELEPSLPAKIDWTER